MPKTKSMALAVAFLATTVVACGASPDASGEVAESSAQAMTDPGASAPSCTYSSVTNWAPPEGAGVEVSCKPVYGLVAWAAVPESGVCRPIKAQTGFWEVTNVSSAPPSGAWYDIQPACAQVGLPSDCCFYGWTGYKAGDLPDQGALCAAMGSQKILEVDACLACPGTPRECPEWLPSSGSCPTCGFSAQ
jgi:hypothetical protein